MKRLVDSLRDLLSSNSTKPLPRNKVARQDRATDRSTKALSRIEEALRAHASELELSGLNLTKVPEYIGQLQQLQSLGLKDNQLTS